jgi:hypothetical protein
MIAANGRLDQTRPIAVTASRDADEQMADVIMLKRPAGDGMAAAAEMTGDCRIHERFQVAFRDFHR